MDHVYQSNVSQSPTKLVGYQSGYPQSATPSNSATIPGPYWYYSVAEEILNAIKAGGVVPDAQATNQLATAVGSIASQVATQTVSPFTTQIANAATNAAAAVVASQTAQSASAAAMAAVGELAQPAGAYSVGFQAGGASQPQGSVGYKLRAYKDSHDTNCIHDGTADTTVQMQALFSYAWDALFYQSQVWTGVDTLGVNPVIKVAPGRFKLSSALTLATGASLSGFGHPANTVSHTRLIMNSTATSPPSGVGDNRNKPIIKFTRATHDGGGLANATWTGAISNLEFWYVTGSNNFDNPLSGDGITPKVYPNGGSLFIDVDMIDARFENLCFQHAPAAVRGLNVSSTAGTRGDGFPGGYGINAFFKGCEFDAAAMHLWFTNCNLDLEFDNCAFYGGISLFEGCTGRVIFKESCRFYGGAFIDAATGAGNHFSEFVCNARMEGKNDGTFSVAVFGADFAELSPRITKAGNANGVVAVACKGGIIAPVIQDSGYNASPGSSPNDFTAAVKLIGCQNVVVAPKISVLATGGAYNGFGVLSVDGSSAPAYGTGLPSSIIVEGAVVSGPYNAGGYNGQNRYINIAAGDIRLNEYQTGRPAEIRSNVGVNLRGNTLVDRVLLASPGVTTDLAALIIESGVYLITAETQYSNNLAFINSGTFKLTRRNAGGATVEQLGISNTATATGVISLSGTVLSYSYSAGNGYYLTVRFNKIADGGFD